MSEPAAEHMYQTTIEQLRPTHQSISWLTGGDNREVAVVDNREVFRFAKNEEDREVNRYEYAVLQLLQDKLPVHVPVPLAIDPDGLYNVLTYLQGTVLSKDGMAALPIEKRRRLSVDIVKVINELNRAISRDDVLAIPTTRTKIRFRNGYYESVYQQASQRTNQYAALYREQFEQLQRLRPDGPQDNMIVFGDLTAPNMVLAEDDTLHGLIDWTELGFGDIHNELRPVFSVLGQDVFDSVLATLNGQLPPVSEPLVRQLSIVHELSVLVSGKQRGVLTPAREKLAMDSVMGWLH